MKTNDFNQGSIGLFSPSTSNYYTYSTATLDNVYIDATPEVNVLHNKNRRKKFVDKIYLENDNEFELEIYNPSTSTLGILIEMNGSLISNSHLVINPGQRIVLDRFIDTKNKFKFSTYDVENTDSAKKAIKNNGKITITFYKEKTVQKLNINNYPYLNGNIGTTYQTFTCDFNSPVNNGNKVYFSSDIGNTSNHIETGKIEQGNTSDQTFGLSYINFNTCFSNNQTLFILPLSQKPVESKDLIRYCPECSTKLKKEWKFCANCGTSTEEKEDEIILELVYKTSSELSYPQTFELYNLKTDFSHGVTIRSFTCDAYKDILGYYGETIAYANLKTIVRSGKNGDKTETNEKITKFILKATDDIKILQLIY